MLADLHTFVVVTEPVDAMLDELTTEAAVLRVYRQAFAVLAREAGAMILDADLIDVDEAILEAFAAAGGDGLTAAEVAAACHRFDPRAVERRLGVLIEQAGTTQALGLLPAETWVSFARRSDTQTLAAVLDEAGDQSARTCAACGPL